ncbi:hypothetical protein VCHENC02_1007 [Vibrio harveyi]|uniref:Uncharacterized protein n=1 Tax=Vibrio harveyi TaxID=669 RepID=A0A454D4D2_VIBHA|nr:hypothetical protein VCHENC02_1007 [Vibrio harveyi]
MCMLIKCFYAYGFVRYVIFNDVDHKSCLRIAWIDGIDG